MPYTQECNDVAMMLIQHHKATEYPDRAIDQFEQLSHDAQLRPRDGRRRAPLHHGRAARLQYFRRRSSTSRLRRRRSGPATDPRLVQGRAARLGMDG